MEQRIDLRNLEARLRERDSDALAEEQKNKVLLRTSELKKMEEKTDKQRTGLGVTRNVVAEMERAINLPLNLPLVVGEYFPQFWNKCNN